jgi:hypothetical protein
MLPKVPDSLPPYAVTKSILLLLQVLRACWQQAPWLRADAGDQRQARACFGALDAVSGAFHTAEHDRKLAVHFVAFLQRLADAYPAEPLVLLLDNVQMHDSKAARLVGGQPAGVGMGAAQVRRPRRQPAERIWGLIKDDVATSWLAGTVAELTGAAHRFFATLPPHPVPATFSEAT